MALNEQTGLDFVISGGLKLQQEKPLQLSVSDATIGHARETLASFKRLSLDFDGRTLLDRQLIIDNILLQSAQINLRLDSQRKLNLDWQGDWLKALEGELVIRGDQLGVGDGLCCHITA